MKLHDERSADYVVSGKSPERTPGYDVLNTIVPDVLQEIRQTLIEQETAYQRESAEGEFYSLWSHSCRVGHLAFRIAQAEGANEDQALLAGLLHDTGKFAYGIYHQDDIPEEKHAVRFAERILTGTVYENWIPVINEAILSAYLKDEATSEIGRILHDADCLDKLGNTGVAQFFSKNALRRHFLDDDIITRVSVELTYAYHTPHTLKTSTGRLIARDRSSRSRRFYTELVKEWSEAGLGDFNIVEEDIAGIICILVVPAYCWCGGRLRIESDIRDAMKCRSAIVNYVCVECNCKDEFSFCLPNVKGLPNK